MQRLWMACARQRTLEEPSASQGDWMTDSKTPQPETGPDAVVGPTPFSSLSQFLAFGFGSGLSPRAPGTVGTLAAVPIYWLMAGLDLWLYTSVVILAMSQ